MKKAAPILAILSVMFVFSFNNVLAQGLGLQGLGGRLSFIDPENRGGTIGFGGHADLGEIIKNLVLYPSFEYWSKDRASSFSINGDLRYYFPTSGNIEFFAGGGLAISFVDTGPSNETDLGLDILGGADFPVSDNLVATAKIKFLLSGEDVLKLTGGITYLWGN